MLHIINPVGGAVFGAASALTGIVVNSFVQKPEITQTANKVALWAVTVAARIGAGMLAVAAAGFTLTVTSAVGMSIAILVSLVVVHFGIGCCAACCGGLAGVNNT